MARYDMRMNMIRSGQTLPDDAEQYDPMADIKAHKSHVKVGPGIINQIQHRVLTLLAVTNGPERNVVLPARD